MGLKYDIARQSSTTSPQVVDNDTTTCLRSSHLPVSFSWPERNHYFRFIRFYHYQPIDKIPKKEELNILVENSAGAVPCQDEQRIRSGSVILDVYCTLTDLISKVTLSGQFINGLCTVYISPGRNLAILSSVISHKTIRNPAIVDGNVATCSSSNSKENPFWKVMFRTHAYANYYYTIWNKGDFTYSTSIVSGNESIMVSGRVFHKREILPLLVTDPQNLYKPVTQLTLEADDKTANNKTLGLCELRAFGDCAPNAYGLDCDYRCPDKCEQCDVQLTCIGCKKGYFGQYCQYKCNKCAGDTSCDKLTGVCTHGCTHRYRGNNCNHFCINCNEQNSSCEQINGTCLNGCRTSFTSHSCLKNCPYCEGNGSCERHDEFHCNFGCIYGARGKNCYVSAFGLQIITLPVSIYFLSVAFFLIAIIYYGCRSQSELEVVEE
ncbi:uncharacterized protein LOC131939886 [Physella acuta]|uniref:uncharacterized protein LOC131939886 n=1 Tax=Physella acuta TaxID=109671 RepID=UPI0027DB6479|nr:uncharacterized protein LOC131939886 [Physella acuta]